MELKVDDLFSFQFHLSDKVYNGFMDCFMDKNPMHTDSLFAKSKGFEDKVMHGNILNGFLSYFIGEQLPVKNIIILSQQIQYSKPVYLNDSLQLNARITGIFDSVNVAEFTFQFVRSPLDVVAKGKVQIKILI